MFKCKTKTWITCGCLLVLFIILLSSCTNAPITPPVSPTATISSFNRVVFRDGFDSQDGKWGTYSSEDGSAFYEKGKLHIRNYTASVYPSSSHIQQQFSDFALEVEMELVSGSSANWQSVISRYNGVGDSYMFCINANGKYSILKAIGGVATMLRAPTSSSHIRTGLGVTNNIRVECIRNSLTLYVNGFSVAQVSDNTLVSGSVGFSVESISSEYSEVAFDNVVIRTP